KMGRKAHGHFIWRVGTAMNRSPMTGLDAVRSTSRRVASLYLARYSPAPCETTCETPFAAAVATMGCSSDFSCSFGPIFQINGAMWTVGRRQQPNKGHGR